VRHCFIYTLINRVPQCQNMSRKLINVLNLTLLNVYNCLLWNSLRIPSTKNCHYYCHFANYCCDFLKVQWLHFTGVVDKVIIAYFHFFKILHTKNYITPPHRRGVLSNTAIRPSIRMSIPALGVQLPWAIGTLAACSLATCGLRIRPRTDVDPPRVELPRAEGISSCRPRCDNLLKSVHF